MAQTQYVYFGAPLKSWEQNINFLGVLNPGRYSGFDTLDFISSWVFNLKHDGSNLSFQDFNQVNQGPWGKYLTRQGVLITETAEIGPFTLDDNSTNDYWRYDYVMASHAYDPIAGQQADATYSLVKGPTNSMSPAITPLTEPHKQVVLAIIAIPPLASVHDDVYIVKTHTQGVGQQPEAKLYENNAFRGTQQWYQYPTDIALPEENGFWELPAGANSYKINPTDWRTYIMSVPVHWDLWAIRIKGVDPQNGTRITLKMPASVQIWDNYFPELSNFSWNSKGYRKINIPAELTNKVSGDKNILTQPAGCWDWYVDLEMVDDIWVVKAVNTHGGSSGNMASVFSMDKAPLNGYMGNQDTHVAQAGFFTPTGIDSETFFPTFGIKKRAGGIIFGEFNGDAIKTFRGCTLRLNGAICLRADFSGITQDEKDDPILTYLGGGSIFLKLSILRTPQVIGQVAYTQNIVLDYIGKGDVKPKKSLAFTTGPSSLPESTVYEQHTDIMLSGTKTVTLNPGDEVKLAIEVAYGDTRVSFSTFAYQEGMCYLEAHYLGINSAYAG